jgi:hypothetical protein
MEEGARREGRRKEGRGRDSERREEGAGRAEENYWGPQMALLGPTTTNGTSGAHDVLYNRILVPSVFYFYNHSKRATLKHANYSCSRRVPCKHGTVSLLCSIISYHPTHPKCQNFDPLWYLHLCTYLYQGTPRSWQQRFLSFCSYLFRSLLLSAPSLSSLPFPFLRPVRCLSVC